MVFSTSRYKVGIFAVFFRGYSGGVFDNELESRYFLPGFIRGNCGGIFHIKLEGR